MPRSSWSFYSQILKKALNELEYACSAAPESREFRFYRAEAPVVLEEAREALAALDQMIEGLDDRICPTPPSQTRH